MSRYRARIIGILSCLAAGVLISLAGIAPEAADIGPLQFTEAAHAQSLSHPFAGQGIVYVVKNGEWREAFIRQVSSRTSQGRTSWLYGVEYLSGARELENNVAADRIRTIAQAQSQGLTTNVYDLSTQAGIDQMVAAHNAPRRAVGVPDVRWSSSLATSAQQWANQLLRENRFEHSPRSLRNNGNIGENLASRSSSGAGGAYSTPTRAVEGWVNERNYYNYAANTCQAGQQCGHYTQMVWRSTTEVGCGVARNANASREIWVCHYSPAGNIVGRKPY
ncbi:MAG TPA: CAP domain-containing protein [Trichocoleus sp.]